MNKGTIIVTSLREAPIQLRHHGARHAIGILGPEAEHPVFEELPETDHLRLSFHDVAAAVPGLSAPRSEDMVRLLTFLRGWNGASPMLIHCWAGISRSTAAGYIATCLLRPQDDEWLLARELRAAAPSATPNPLLVALADEALGREGRMIAAINTIGRGADAFEGTPFRLAV
jgi:predicted protein tyrosine phosphatase